MTGHGKTRSVFNPSHTILLSPSTFAQVELVKWQGHMVDSSLMMLEHPELNKMALECFACIMRFMGDLPLAKNQLDVECVLVILNCCHNHEELKDEVFCQIMKQTTNNKSEVGSPWCPIDQSEPLILTLDQ